MDEKKPYILNGERVTLEEYRKTKYEDLRIRVPKGRKDEIQAHAAAKGESLNGYIIKAVDERIERDRSAADDAKEGGKMPLPQQNERYTYADYCTWDDSERCELIEGIPYAMSPAPAPRHQEISGEIHSQLHIFLKGKPCKVFHAPFDVRLNADNGDDTVVQPDLIVICDRSKIDDKGCKGATDLVIEILSPSTARMDKLLKFNQYQLAGVREYWIIDPDTKTVQVFVFETGSVRAYADTDTAPVSVLSGCTINLQEVFAE